MQASSVTAADCCRRAPPPSARLRKRWPKGRWLAALRSSPEEEKEREGPARHQHENAAQDFGTGEGTAGEARGDESEERYGQSAGLPTAN